MNLSSTMADDGAVGVAGKVGMTPAETWGYGFLFVTIINMSSIMGILFFPLMNKKIYATVMRVMIGLAIGSLSGSALFHLIPKALQLQDQLTTLGFVWMSIWGVMLLESAMKIGLRDKKGTEDKLHESDELSIVQNNNPRHNSVPMLTAENDDTATPLNPIRKATKTIMDEKDGIIGNLSRSHGDLPIYHSSFSLNKHTIEVLRKDEMNDPPDASKKTKIKTVAWVVIFGDGLHNFIDGMSIGAAFVTDFNTGVVMCLAIICEEFPHELGDFAILINSGLSVKKALLFNFLSALTCYMGLVLGILLGEVFDWSYYIFGIAAGIFLYVALADMVPEVSEMIEEASNTSAKKAWGILFTHHVGIFLGISILYILAKYLPE